jgi:hypothetical protein
MDASWALGQVVDMKTGRSGLALAVALLVAACSGGGSGSTSAGPGTGGTGNDPGSNGSTKTTPGVWQGTITSPTTGTSSLMVFTDDTGHSVWMTTDGRVWAAQMPVSAIELEVSMAGHMYPGAHFPDGTNHGTWSMHTSFADGTWSGHLRGAGDDGTFTMSMHPARDRPASLATLAGTYTRTTSIGYTMTMSVTESGQLTANDTHGCLINGTVTVPDPAHNHYRIAATVTSCGVLDGTYEGHGTLVDASTMQGWTSHMGCFQYGQDGMMGGGMGHGGMHGWWPVGGTNTVPSGTRNLLMFAISNGQYAIMDALAR